MARSHMGRDKVRGHQHVGTADPDIIEESDLGSETQGNNRLHGNDQKNVRNQRTTMPDELAERPKGPAQPHNIPRPAESGSPDD